ISDFFEVLVLFWRLAVLLSWIRMLKISPTCVARLSATRLRAAPSCQSDWPRVRGAASNTAIEILQINRNGFFILNLSAEFAPRFEIAHSHELAGQAVFERFDFHQNLQRPILHERVERFATLNHRPLF